MNKVVYIVLTIAVLFNFHQCNNSKYLEKQIESNADMLEALTDSVKYSTDKYNREVASKKVIEATVKDLEKANAILTDNQRNLIKEVKTVKNLKTGIQIQERITIDTLTINNDKTVLIEETKKGTIVKIINSNDSVQTVEMDAIFIPTKKKWYNKKGFKIALFIAGVATGIAVSK
jgi:hypothetical protein